jgi:quinol monooxygenase YgiN
VSERKVLVAEIVALPGCEDRLAVLLTELAERVRSEAGNVLFEPATVERDPLRFLVYEQYRDEDAFTSHLAAAHTVEFNSILVTLAENGRSELTGLSPLA